METFGKHLKQLRKAADLTIRQAARKAGVSEIEWDQMEDQDVMPTLRMFRPIAEALGVQPSEVL